MDLYCFLFPKKEYSRFNSFFNWKKNYEKKTEKHLKAYSFNMKNCSSLSLFVFNIYPNNVAALHFIVL